MWYTPATLHMTLFFSTVRPDSLLLKPLIEFEHIFVVSFGCLSFKVECS